MQVDRSPADEGSLVCTGRGPDAFALESAEKGCVDGRVPQCGDTGFADGLERPMRPLLVRKLRTAGFGPTRRRSGRFGIWLVGPGIHPASQSANLVDWQLGLWGHLQRGVVVDSVNQ